jgi:hypothetical protein
MRRNKMGANTAMTMAKNITAALMAGSKMPSACPISAATIARLRPPESMRPWPKDLLRP